MCRSEWYPWVMYSCIVFLVTEVFAEVTGLYWAFMLRKRFVHCIILFVFCFYWEVCFFPGLYACYQYNSKTYRLILIKLLFHSWILRNKEVSQFRWIKVKDQGQNWIYTLSFT